MNLVNTQPPPAPQAQLPAELPIYIDSSMLSTFRSCKKKFEWTTLKALKPLGQSIHLAAGGAMAAGLEAARNHQFITSPHQQLPTDDLLHAAIGPYLKGWDLYDPDEEQTKNAHNVFHALEYYLNEYPPFLDPVQPVIKPDGKPATEYTFGIPLPIMHPTQNTPFIFVGRFDLLGTYGGLPVVLDDKTTSALGPYWMAQWHLRGQFMGYVWACNQLEYSIDHVIVRGLCIQKTQHQLASVPIQYPTHVIDRWYITLLQTIEEMIHFYTYNEWPYNFSDACSSYGGCTFRDLCLAKNPDTFLSNFEHNTWSPVSADA